MEISQDMWGNFALTHSELSGKIFNKTREIILARNVQSKKVIHVKTYRLFQITKKPKIIKIQ